MTTTKRSGTLEGPFTDANGKRFWRGKVRLQDGSRSRVEIPDPKLYSETASRNHVAFCQEDEDATHAIYLAKLAKLARPKVATAPVVTDEGDRWFGAWEAARIKRGLSSVRDNRRHFMSYIRPAVRGKHVRDWTSEDGRAIVALLDSLIAGGEISAKYAGNIWGTATKMSADAVKSKVETLRVRQDNPLRDVEGPDDGDERTKQFLYPSEFVQLVSCADIPSRWRRAIVLAIYAFPRAGELRALRWEDVDLAHGLITVHQAFDRRTRETGSTKSGKGRNVPIEPTLVPLLRVMHAERDESGLVCPMPNRMASRLREWLTKAGVTRRALTDETSETTKPLAWHDLRATGLTWCAVRGDEPMKIMQRAGHADLATTMLYVRTADAVGTSFGNVFPTLPDALVGASTGIEPAATVTHAPAQGKPRRSPRSVTRRLSERNVERDTGFEPATSSLGSWHSLARVLVDRTRSRSRRRAERLKRRALRAREIGAKHVVTRVTITPRPPAPRAEAPDGTRGRWRRGAGGPRRPRRSGGNVSKWKMGSRRRLGAPRSGGCGAGATPAMRETATAARGGPPLRVDAAPRVRSVREP